MYNIMIVDDEPSIVEGLVSKINRCEIEDIGTIYKALNVNSALDIFKNEEISIVITDIEMPLVDGLELIDSINKIDDSVVKIVISGYDYFKYVKSAFIEGAIDYLLKPVSIEQLKGTLVKSIEILSGIDIKKTDAQLRVSNEKGEMLRELVHKAKQDELKLTIELALKDCGINTIYQYFNFIEVDEQSETDNINAESIVYQQLITDEMHILFYKLDKKITYIFNSDDESYLDLIPSRILDIYKTRNLDIYIYTIGIISKDNDYLKANIDLEKSSMNKMLSKINTVFNYTQIEDTKKSDYIIDLYVSKLKAAISIGNYDDYSNIIEETFENNKIINYGIDFVETMYKRVINIINYKSNIYQSIEFEDFTSINQLIDFLKKYFKLSSNSLSKKTTIVEFTEDYISKNMDKKINMAYIANLFDMNYSVFSKEFTKETGMNFSKFVILKKMDYAKHLIETTNKSIGSISAELSYINPKNFTRVFKQTFGYSPNEYKNKLIK